MRLEAEVVEVKSLRWFYRNKGNEEKSNRGSAFGFYRRELSQRRGESDLRFAIADISVLRGGKGASASLLLTYRALAAMLVRAPRICRLGARAKK